MFIRLDLELFFIIINYTSTMCINAEKIPNDRIFIFTVKENYREFNKQCF